MNADTLHQLSNDLIRDEGLRLKPYKCTAGKLTIGVGRNIEDNGISEEEARMMLSNDIHNSIAELQIALPFFNLLSENRQRALINMHFNIGLSRLLGFKNMLKCMREGNFEQASNEALDSRWAKQVGQRANRIAELIKKG
jgi:lysozyme